MPYVPTPRKNKSVYRNISYDLDGKTIEEAISCLQEIREKTQDAKLDYGDHDLYESQYGMYLRTMVPETDKEMSARHKKEQDQFDRDEADDCKEFKRLSKKFKK